MLLFGFRRGITLRSPGGSCCRFAAGRGCVGALADEPCRTARFSAPFPFVLPRACRELLSAFASGNRTNFLQNDDIQSIFFFLHRTGNKKRSLGKGSFVRIKVLRHICKPNVYQRFATLFRLPSPHRLPSFCTVLHPPARFACAAAVSPCMTIQI